MEDIYNKEKNAYFESYCTSKGSAVSFYVERIINNKLSSLEKDNLLNKIYELIDEVEDVSKINNIKKHNINMFDNYLYLLSNDDYINNYLTRINYYQEMNLINLIINNKVMLNQYLNNKEIQVLDLLIKYNMIDTKDKELISEYFIKLIIQRESYNYIITQDTFKMLLEYFFNKISISYNNASYSIDDNDFNNFFNNGDIDIFSNFYHNLYYNLRNYEISKEHKCSPLIIKEIKDHVLSDLIDNYENDNKDSISYLVGADIFSLKNLLNLFNKLNILINNMNFINNKLEYLNNQVNNNMRIVNGKTINLNDAFKSIIEDHMEYLDIYPQLEKLIGKGTKNDRS